MHIPKKQYRKIESKTRKNFLIFSLAGAIFLLTIFFSSYNLGNVQQASILGSVKDTATSTITKVATDKVANTLSGNSTLSAAQNLIGSDPSSLLNAAGSLGNISNLGSLGNLANTGNLANAATGLVTNQIASVVPTNALTSLSNLNVGTLGSALNISSFTSSFSSSVASSAMSKAGSALGFGGGGTSIIDKIKAMGYEERRDFFGSKFTTVDEVASIIEQLPATTARDTVLDMMDTGNASQVVNAISIGQAKSILGQMTKDNGARIMNGMDPERAVSLLGQFSPADALQRLSLMDETKRAEALRLMSSSQLAAICNVMTPENAADVLTKIDLSKAVEVYKLMDVDQRREAVNRLDTETYNSIINRVLGLASIQTSEKSTWDYVVDVFGIQTAHAADSSDTISTNSTIGTYQDILKKLNDLLAFIFFVIHQVFFWPLTFLLGSLLDNDFIMGSQLSETLRSIWIQVRDLVNIAFVFVLLIMALIAVIGSQELEEKLPMRSTLPKIIIAMVLVNFTFFISRVAIDAVNVMTTAVYSIAHVSKDDADLSDVKLSLFQSDSCDMNRYNYDCDAWLAKCYATEGGTNFGSATLEQDILKYQSKPELMEVGTLSGYGCITNGGVPGPYEQCVADKKSGKTNYFIRENVEDALTSEYFTYDPSTKEVTYTDENKYALERDHIFCHYPMATQATLGNDSNQTTINNGVAYAIAKNFESLIDTTTFYNNREIKSPDNFLTFLLNNIFIIFMFVAIFFALLAVVVALVIRAAALWVIIAISPLIVVQQVVFKGIGGVSILDQFIKYLLIPLKVAFVFTLAFIFMSAIDNMFAPDIPRTLEQVWGFIIGKDVNTNLIAPSGENVSILQYILYLVITVGILWVGVFKAFEGTYADKLTGGIKSAGNWVMSSPKYARVVPMPGVKGGVSVAGLKHAFTGFKTGLDMNARSEFKQDKGQAISLAKEHKGNKFIIRIQNDHEAIKDLHNGDQDYFRKTMTEADLKLNGADIKKLKLGDEKEWQKITNKKDGKMIQDWKEMAVAMRRANGSESTSSSSTSTKTTEILKDAGTTAGTAVAINQLQSSLKTIEEHVNDKNTQENKKVDTIQKTAKQTEKEDRGTLSERSAKEIAQALRDIDKKNRDDALEGLNNASLLRIAKAMGINEVTVRGGKDENTNSNITRNYNEVDDSGEIQYGRGQTLPEMKPKHANESDEDFQKRQAEFEQRRKDNMDALREETINQIKEA